MPLTAADIAGNLHLADTIELGDRRVRLLFLLPESLWRPLRTTWWQGKEVSLIAGDERGNYILRHCDGSVRLWDHLKGEDEVIASSVREFLAGLKGVAS